MPRKATDHMSEDNRCKDVRVARLSFFSIITVCSGGGCLGLVGLAEWCLSEDPLAEVLLLVIGCHIKLVALLSCFHAVPSELIDVLTVELWANQVDLVLVGHGKQALGSGRTPLDGVDDFVGKFVLSDHLARTSVPNDQVMIFIA